MYLQFKHGFVEVDRWDGTPIGDGGLHQKAIDAAQLALATSRSPATAKHIDSTTMIVRSREQSTIKWIVSSVSRRPIIFQCPPDWDYEWRCYLHVAEWCDVMVRISKGIDYRNFKSWTKENGTPKQVGLVHDIWQMARDRWPSSDSNDRAAWAHFDETPSTTVTLTPKARRDLDAFAKKAAAQKVKKNKEAAALKTELKK